jgi:nucleotide-binding universal stress UspA family protein
MQIQVSPLGIIIAIVFFFSMGGILWWMLHPPPQIKPEVAKARRSVEALKRILVPTSGMPYSERGIELACRLGAEHQAEIVLTYVIEVPRTLPLDAPMPEAEEQAKQILNRGKEIVELHHLPPVILVERAREAGEGIIRAAKDNQVDVIVLGMRTDLHGAQSIWGRTSDTLIRKAPCEVILDKLPESS